METKELIRQLVREVFQVTDEKLNEKVDKLEQLFELMNYDEVNEKTEFPTESTSSNHLYEYSILAEITDDTDTCQLRIIGLSGNYFANFDTQEGQEQTITFADFLNMIISNQMYSLDGTIDNAIWVSDDSISMGGWTSFDSDHVNFLTLEGKQIY